MPNHCPPQFGTLRPIVPILQFETRGPWRLPLTTLEDWDTCWAVNADLVRDPLRPGSEYLSPSVTRDALKEGGETYVSWFGGGFCGGRIDGGQERRTLARFAPTIDLEAESTRIEARLHLSQTVRKPSGLDLPRLGGPRAVDLRGAPSRFGGSFSPRASGPSRWSRPNSLAPPVLTRPW